MKNKKRAATIALDDKTIIIIPKIKCVEIRDLGLYIYYGTGSTSSIFNSVEEARRAYDKVWGYIDGYYNDR